MSESWNLETVAESKTEIPAQKAPTTAAPEIPSVLSNDHSLGKIMAMARDARGFTREQAAKSSNIPVYYLNMIESDDYSSIADQLYLLPFLRRYASFVGLEAEEVASRFIRDVQRADMNPPKFSAEPMAMIADRRPFPWRTAIAALVGLGALAALGWFGYQKYAARKAAQADAPNASMLAQPIPAQPAASAAAPSQNPQINNPQQNGSSSSDAMEPDTAAVAPAAPKASATGGSQPASSSRSVITTLPASTTSLDASPPEGSSIAKPAASSSPNAHSTKSSKHRKHS